jgi:hypothetical protein
MVLAIFKGCGMTLDEAVGLIEEHFDCEDGPAGPLDAEGRAYVVLMSGGLTKEAQGFPAIYRTPELAAEAWHQAFCWHAAGEVGILALDFAKATIMVAVNDRYRVRWRIRPEMNEAIVHVTDIASDDLKLVPQTWYTVYSRFTISKVA